MSNVKAIYECLSFKYSSLLLRLNINSAHIQLQNELILHTSLRSKVHCARYLSRDFTSQVLPLVHISMAGKFIVVLNAALQITWTVS